MLSVVQLRLLDELVSVKVANPNTELESRITKSISIEQFKRLAKFLTNKISGYTRTEEPEVLDINFYERSAFGENGRNLSMRYSVIGLENIQNYCRTEKPYEYSAMYKSRIQWPSQLIEKNPSIQFSTGGITIDVNEFDYRINLKSEVLPDANGTFSDPQATEASSKLSSLIDKVGYENVFKTFRFKKRVSFLDETGNYRIDLTMVKNSKKNIYSNDYVLTKSFKESNTINEKESYEVEIEYVGKTNQDIPPNLIEKMNLVHVKLFSKTDRSLSNTQQQNVLIEYGNLIKEMLIDTARRQKKEIENLANGILDPNKYNLQNNFKSQFDQIDMNNYRQNTVYRSLENKIRNIGKMSNNDNKMFFAPKVISIGIENIQAKFGANILTNYTITDKADGETMILYCSSNVKKTEICMIDTNMNVYPVIMSDKPLAGWSQLVGSILVGEFVSKKKLDEQLPTDDERLIPGFYCFDIYVRNNRDTRMLPLVSSKPDQPFRIQIANDVIDGVNRFGKMNVELNVKTFYSVSAEPADKKEIFKLTKAIWDRHDTGFPYDLDGVIYTPADMPVGFDRSNWNWATQMSSRWVYNMKWKPSAENTIDFLVQIEKEVIEIDKEKNIYITRDKIRENLDFKPYKTVHLYNGYSANYNGNPCSAENKKGARKDITKYVKTLFTPTNPNEPNAYIAHIFLDENNNMLGEKDKCRILDNTIVEFGFNIGRYVSSRSDAARAELWKPLRTRLDRTETYEKALLDKERTFRVFQKYMRFNKPNGYRWKQDEVDELQMLKVIIDKFRLNPSQWQKPDISPDEIYHSLTNFENKMILNNVIKDSSDIPINIVYGNDFEVANSIWNSIHNPITEEMITTGNKIPKLDEMEEIYYNRDASIARDKSVSIQLQEFHNKFVKDIELYGKASKMLKEKTRNASGISADIHLLDLACGKGGDLFKWNKNNISRVVGIDINSNNIYDPKDGACIRYTEFKKKMTAFHIDTPLQHVDFLYGDISENIKSGDAMKAQPSVELQQELWSVYNERKFDMVSIQFALHYLFESKSKLDGFITNVSENLRPGGLFIGTCFDGNRVYQFLKDKNIGESKTGEIGGKTIYKIKKLYTNVGEELPSNIQGVGLPIEVYIPSINQSIKEYLVSFDLLKDEMAKIHLVPVETELFSDIYDRYNSSVNLKDVEQELSFLNRRFIFRKLEKDEITIEDAYRKIKNLIDSNNRAVSGALSVGLQQSNWESFRALLPQIQIEVSDSEFEVLTQRLLSKELHVQKQGGNVLLKKTTRRKVSPKNQIDMNEAEPMGGSFTSKSVASKKNNI